MKYTLNGDEVEANRVTYEEISELAGYPSEMSPSVTYRNAGNDGYKEGILCPGESVIVNEKTIINCHDTSNA